ncbi:MAG: 4-alpha-glucanotransferase, partial [Bacteroidota bacterium]
QILPLGPTGYADSPYQCFSSEAGNPLLINLDLLVEEKYLDESDLNGHDFSKSDKVDYGKLIDWKIPLLKKAAARFFKESSSQQRTAYHAFLKSNGSWLPDYAMFMSLKEHFNQEPWYNWEQSVKIKNDFHLTHYFGLLNEKIEYQKFVQYQFFRQWSAVKDYANQRNIRIIGDIPLYVSLDSADAWAHSDIFMFDKEKNPIAVGGVPPDYFSVTGQLWGNPLYDWEVLKRQDYRWWIDRIKSNLVLYDIIRIDHFRGFAAYWSVPYGEKTAINGKWVTGPGKDLFKAIRKELGDIPVIAEDLGVITDDVEDLRDSFDLPGMKILQFAFDSGEANDYIPHNFTRNSVVYTGTHDNDTVVGWLSNAKEEDKQYLKEYLNSNDDNLCWNLIRASLASVSYTSITPMQDLLCLGNDARMNLPGTTINNWMWRAKEEDFSTRLAEKLAWMTKLYGRSQ